MDGYIKKSTLIDWLHMMAKKSSGVIRETYLDVAYNVRKMPESKPCKYCKPGQLAVMHGSDTTWDGISKGCRARFCPNCGKPLIPDLDLGDRDYSGLTDEE